MACNYSKYDQHLEQMLSEMLNDQNSSGRQPFELPGTPRQYAPDREVDVTHIKLTLSFEINNQIMFGECETQFTAIRDDLSRLTLDAAEMEIRSVRDSAGTSLEFEHTGSKLIINLPEKLEAGGESTVLVEYKVVEPRLGLYFVLPDDDYPDKPVQVWTQGQDEDSKYWFPCFDYPNEKASSEIIVTVDEKYFALSNGKLLETTHNKESGEKTYHWKQEIPHVSYLISLVVGEYVEHTDYYEDIPVSYYVAPGMEEEGARSFGKTPDMVKFFSEKLNFKYPYEKYAQIAVEDFVFGGMENTTATTQTALTLHDERAHLDFESEPLVAHELAHQWFGDLLTCKEWNHAWLNEGFATYFEALYREHDKGDDEFRYALHENATRYFGEDSKKYRRPIVVDKYREPIDVFDRHLYEKGSLVLHMLRCELGDETFWDVMHHYVTKHQQQNVETIDLIRAIEDVTGRNMKKFFDQWVFGAGYPELEVNYTWNPDENGDSGTAKVIVKQTHEIEDDTPLFDFPVEIRFVLPKDEVSESLRINEKEQVFYFNLEQKPEQFLFDPEYWILKQTKLQVPQELLLSQLMNATDVMARIDAAQALKKDPSAKVVDALGKALQEEEFWGVQAEIAKVLGGVKTTRARDHLISALDLEHPKTRRAVVQALGNYHDAETAEALSPLAKSDPSYFVESSANTSLGKTRADGVYEILKSSLGKESFNEVIRSGVFNGFAELKNDEAIGELVSFTQRGKSPLARAAAAVTLGKMGEDDDTAKRRLLDLLTPEEHFRVKMSVLAGLQHLSDLGTVTKLKDYAEQEGNGMLKRTALLAARTIQKGQQQSKAVKELQDEVEKLRTERMSLVDRLEKIESQLNNEKEK
ncbi:MAG: M1 family metallopeptidase [Candidatus Marinimicrobia bacterium]|nr:M1 family metallopeptidase [Candidatus Neomarinimicrobiota bacterium]MCF7828513.1 M1 family metallopeptidase [Candidatus Neomarinimicrobiota bacterium]MCF7882064.1 M1 family metallopeptidase [Candidatus Neomarinimicrobiota bacterium]